MRGYIAETFKRYIIADDEPGTSFRLQSHKRTRGRQAGLRGSGRDICWNGTARTWQINESAVFENEHDIGSPSLPATNVQVDAMKTTNEARDADESAGEADQEEIELEFDASDAFLMASPTLERIDEYDVELDMDGWDLEEDSGEDDDEDMSEESDEEDGAFDFV